jgi:hypothetical protein
MPSITDWNDLDDIRNDLSADYTLENDLDQNTNGYDDVIENNNFEPIGSSGPISFTGTFDGQDNKIKDFNQTVSGNSIGLFKEINGVVENLTIEGQYTDSNKSELNGGILSHTGSGGEIRDCTVKGSISTSSDTGFIGGFLSNNIGTSFYRCRSNVDVSTNGDASGSFVGLINDSAITIQNSYATGNASADGVSVGGFTSDIASGTIENCYSTGEVTGNASNINGFANPVGGTVNNCFWDTETSGITTSGAGTAKTTSEMKDITTYTDTNTTGLNSAWDFQGTENDDQATSDIWTIKSDVNNGYPELDAFIEEVKEFNSNLGQNNRGTSSEAILNEVLKETPLKADIKNNSPDVSSIDEEIRVEIKYNGTVEYVTDVFVEFMNYLDQNSVFSNLEFTFVNNEEKNKFLYNERKSDAIQLVDDQSHIKTSNDLKYVNIDSLVKSVIDKYEGAGRVTVGDAL